MPDISSRQMAKLPAQVFALRLSNELRGSIPHENALDLFRKENKKMNLRTNEEKSK